MLPPYLFSAKLTAQTFFACARDLGVSDSVQRCSLTLPKTKPYWVLQ
jgi:hypothetical protein